VALGTSPLSRHDLNKKTVIKRLGVIDAIHERLRRSVASCCLFRRLALAQNTRLKKSCGSTTSGPYAREHRAGDVYT